MPRKISRRKGSWLHIRDLVVAPDYLTKFEALLGQHGLPVTDIVCWHPNRYDSREYTVSLFLKSCWTVMADQLEDLNQWWVRHGGKTPTWDLLCLGQVDGKPGIVLVEAKAHLGEMNSPKGRSKSNPKKSAENWTQIQGRMKDALTALGTTGADALSLGGEHYQFVNRLTWAHKLANDGLPVVLVYLGFTDDRCWPKDPIVSGSWRKAVASHAQGVLPIGFDDRAHEFGKGKLWFRTVEMPVPDASLCRTRKSR